MGSIVFGICVVSTKMLHIWNGTTKDQKPVYSDDNVLDHYENTPIQIYWKFHLQNLKIFR